MVSIPECYYLKFTFSYSLCYLFLISLCWLPSTATPTLYQHLHFRVISRVECSNFTKHFWWTPLRLLPHLGSLLTFSSVALSWAMLLPLSRSHSHLFHFLSTSPVSSEYTKQQIQLQVNHPIIELHNTPSAMEHNTVFTMTFDFR